MKKIVNLYYLNLLSVLSIFALVGCNSNAYIESPFDNDKVYIDCDSSIDQITFKESSTTFERTLSSAIPSPISRDLEIEYAIDSSKIDEYNSNYSASAIILPEQYYDISSMEAIIYAGSVSSTEVEILFKDVATLDFDTQYLLPITISSVDMNILESKRTIIYSLQGGSLINVVADLGANGNHFIVNWTNRDVVNGLTTITYEALVKVTEIKNLMGIMGLYKGCMATPDEANSAVAGDSHSWWMRFESYELQVNYSSTTADNYGDYEEKTLPGDGDALPDSEPAASSYVNRWVHFAAIFDTVEKRVKLYVDGVLCRNVYCEEMVDEINLGCSNFYIGTDYDATRTLPGQISEVRIWDHERSSEQINAVNYFYEVDPASEGLIAYWKFDEGDGLQITDQTGNGNSAVAQLDVLVWASVNLPK